MKKIITILEEIRQGVDWANESNFIDDELLDSFDMITLIGELEDAYGINIGLEHLEPENFSSVETIAALIKDLGADIL